MATPSEVVGLLAEIAGTGGRIDQAKAISRAVKALNSLDADQKREMAVLVAERVAPDLVPKIAEETGVDLTIAQVQAVLDMARRLEPEDVAELQEVVAAREGLATLPPPVVAATVATTSGPASEPAPDPALEAAPEPAPEPAAPDADAELEARLAAAEEERRALLAEAEEERERAVAAAVAARETAEAEARAALDAAREQADEMLRRAEETAHVEEPDESADGADAAADHAPLAPTQRVAVLGAPDGWQRRRMLERLLRAGDVDHDDASDLIRLVGRPMDRAWVAATAVETGVLDVDDLDGLLDPRAVARLQRRYA